MFSKQIKLTVFHICATSRLVCQNLIENQQLNWFLWGFISDIFEFSKIQGPI